MEMQLAQRMLELVAAVPPGRVTTYGEIAARAGSRSPRLAGWVLSEHSELSDDEIPWHRVLRANGTPAPHIAAEQLARLRAEGVFADDGRIDLRRYRWQD